MNKKVVINTVKLALVASMVAAALTGCCMFGAKNCCCKTPCACCCKTPCCEKKTNGANTSMTIGVGTDGVRMNGDANVGNHGVSAGAGGGTH